MSPSAASAVTPRVLVALAALVWYAGAIVLSIKGGALLTEANGLDPESRWPIGAALLGIAAGTLKAHLIFRHSCRRNLDRIAALASPRLWQFYRPGFFLFLAAMMTLGGTMSRLAHGQFGPLLAVGGLDLSIAVALLGGGVEFWRPAHD